MGLVRNTSITVFGRWVAVAAAAAAGLVVANALGAAGAGTLAMVRVVPMSIAVLLGFGLTTASSYLIGGRHHSAQAVTETTVAVGLLVGGLGCLGWIATADLLHAKFYPLLSREAVALVGFAILLNLLRDYLNSIQQGLQRFTEATIVLCLDDVGALLLLLLLLFAGVAGGTGLIVASSLGGLVLSVLGAIVCLVRAGIHPWPRLHRSIAAEALRFGLKGYVGRLANVLNWRLDLMILSAIASVEVVGCYAVASKVAELFRPLGASLTFVLRPLIASLSATEARRRGVALYRHVFALNLVAVALMALFGGPLILRLFGEEFAPAIPAFHVLLIGLAAFGADPVLHGYNVGIGRPEYNTYTALAGLFVSVVGDLALIPSYGLMGAAIASSAAYSVKAVAFTLIFLATSGVSLGELVGIKELSPERA